MSKSERPVNHCHIFEIARTMADRGIQVGCWYQGEESGHLGAIDGPSVCLDNENGYVFVANTPDLAKVLVDAFTPAGARNLLAKARRQLEDAVRKNHAGYYDQLIDSEISDGWKPAPAPAGTLIEGSPSRLYREKPSANGNGWWAGTRLVHVYAQQHEVIGELKTARRRVEDRLRKDAGFLLDVLRGDF